MSWENLMKSTCTRKCNILLCYCPTKYIVKYHIISRESKETFSKILSIYFNIGGIFRGRYSLLKFNIRYILILATFFRASNLYSCILIEPSLSRRLIPRSLSPSDKNTFPLHNLISGVHISVTFGNWIENWNRDPSIICQSMSWAWENGLFVLLSLHWTTLHLLCITLYLMLLNNTMADIFHKFVGLMTDGLCVMFRCWAQNNKAGSEPRWWEYREKITVKTPGSGNRQIASRPTFLIKFPIMAVMDGEVRLRGGSLASQQPGDVSCHMNSRQIVSGAEKT